MSRPYHPHPTMEFKITQGITGVVTQSQRGLTHLTLKDAKGKLLRIPPGFKCYDKTARSLNGDPLGHEMGLRREMDVDMYRITLCTTNWYEVYWNGKLTTVLSFTWNIKSQ